MEWRGERVRVTFLVEVRVIILNVCMHCHLSTAVQALFSLALILRCTKGAHNTKNGDTR